ncbi:MAG TPA: tripartite tricarboxylate transporter substrate-binding protein [Microvirga sp.]|jgi:tripartite-type tricarboxylate transporter receptor subunit TctC|nr:tripartite tricarboxylate transporter substrate-binding protein [Microvirga sp.]
MLVATLDRPRDAAGTVHWLEAGMLLTRRQALSGLGSLSLMGANTRPTFAASPVTLVEPYGLNSSTGDAAALLRPALSVKLGSPVEIQHIAGDAGGAALRRVSASAPDGTTLLVTQLLSPYSENRADDPNAPSYQKMTAIGLLTGPISTALVVSHASGITDWAAFEKRAHEGKLRMAHNPILLFALPLGMLEAHFSQRFSDVLASTRAEVIAALDQDKADAGFLPTISLLTVDRRPPLRPILTFGGERASWFPDVPTFREVGKGERTAITGAIAVFGPRGMSAAAQATVLQAVREAGGDASVTAAASALRYPLEIKGPEELVAAMDRNVRVIRDMRQYLRAPT